GLQKLRHISVTLTRDGEPEDSTPADANALRVDAPPEWFVAMVRPEPTRLRIPIVLEGRSYGTLLIASHPTDEIAEIWDSIVTQVQFGSAIA
ncbi:LapD/MoxY N-terminal periplasmic domain-containing protein, partial [Acinetobacter baumannii]